MTRGVFITLEGGEGSGKSTQIRRLEAHVKALGRDVVVTREPGGSPGAEDIRKLIVTGAADRWSPLTELLLIYAARADHVEKTIEPALARGAVVISDRFFDSTFAYQGMAGALGSVRIKAVHQAVLQGFAPDLTLILDLPVDIGLERAVARGGDETRFEGKGRAYHEVLRKAFRDIAAREPKRCKLIDASADIDTVTARLIAHIEPVL